MKERLLAWLGLSVVLGLLLAACGTTTPEPQVVKETVVVEQTVKETVIVEGTPQIVEKVVTEVVEKVVTSTPEPEPEAEEPKILRVRLYGDIQNLDPALLVSGNDTVVSVQISSLLVSHCPDSNDICNDLAEEIEQSDDGLQIRFKLREGVQWHDGWGEVTTEDVKYSFERVIDPELASPYAEDWATLDYVEIIDKYNGIIHLKEAYSPLWTTTLSGSAIVCKKYVEEIGLEAYATNPIGSGPYMFDDWKPQEMVVLKKNPNYFGDEPYWDEIHLIPIEDDMAAELALEAGELDFSSISASSLDRFEANPDMVTLVMPSPRYRWIGMNVQNPKLQNINVRKAIMYAIDVPSILAATYLGEVQQQCALIPPGMIGYWDDAPCHVQDLDKAKEYMVAAGLESLDLRLDFQDTTEYRTWAEIAQQNLAEIGINLELNPMESSAFWSTTFGEEAVINNELLALNYSTAPDPSWVTRWFTCDQVGVWNSQSWCNEEFDSLHAKGMLTMDLKEREQIYLEMQRIWEDAYQAVWITNGITSYAHSPDIIPVMIMGDTPKYSLFQPAP